MPTDTQLPTSGDPLQLVLQWTLVVLAALGAWFGVAVIFLPFYFGLKATLDATVSSVQGWSKRILGNAQKIVREIAASFKRLGQSGQIKIFLQNDIRDLRRSAESARKSVSNHMKIFLKKADQATAAAGGVPGVMKRVNEEIDRLKTVPQLDAESIKLVKGRSVAWFRAILITLFWIGIVILNTVMLHEFFKGLVPFRIALFGLNFEVAWAISTFYTFVEFIFGFLLERSNEKRGDARGIGGMQLVLIPFIMIAILVEMILYTILSFDIAWDWPDSIAASIPPWAGGWLGLLGLVIGGGVTFSGYFMGAQWAEVLKGGAVLSMRNQARILSQSLDTLPTRLQRLKDAVRVVQGQPNPDANDELSREGTKLNKEIQARLELLRSKLEETGDRKYPPVSDADDAEIGRFRWKVAGLGLGGASFVLGNILKMSTALDSTAVGEMGFWAPPTFALITTIAMLFAGRLAATDYVVTHAQTAGGTEGEYHLVNHGLGIAQFAAILVAILLFTFGVWAGTDAFRSIDTGGITSSLAMNGATFIAGAFLEDVFRGLGFLGEALVRLFCGAVLALASLLGWIVLLVGAVLNIVISIVAAPALWLWRAWRNRSSTRRRQHPANQAVGAEASNA